MEELLHAIKKFDIPQNDWIELRDLYRRNWPRHILSFYSLKNYIEWNRAQAENTVSIFSTDSNWRKHGTFVLLEFNGPRCNVLFNTLDPARNANMLLEAFKYLPVYRPFTLAAFVEDVRPVAEEYLSSVNANDYEHCDTLLYHLPLKESLKLILEPKAGYTFRPLQADAATFINDLWPHRYPGSDLFIHKVICFNMSLGAYEERTGKLCGWVMQEQIGTIGLLQVLDCYKRQGLGEQLVCQMAVLLANAGMDATATILETNRPSRYLFQKLGFKIIDRVYWYDKLESNENNNNPKLNSIK